MDLRNNYSLVNLTESNNRTLYDLSTDSSQQDDVTGPINVSDVSGLNTTVQRGSDPFIPLYVYITVSITNVIIFGIGCFGNIMVVLVVVKVRNMRTPTNYFLLNLSIADLLVLVICQPAALMEFFAKDRWLIGAAMCKLVPLMENGVLHVSILTMLAVTFERYSSLCHPFKYRMSTTISTTVKTIVSIWIIGIILTLPFLLMTEHEDAWFYDGTPIKVCRTKVNEMWRYCYTILIFILFFVSPFFMLVGFYTLIIRQLMSDKIQKDRIAVNTLRSRKQVVRMLVFIVVLFFVSLFPIRVVSLWLIFTPPQEMTQIGLEGYLNLISWARILMYINSAGNPIIYRMTSTKFKVAFRRVLRREKSLTKRDLHRPDAAGDGVATRSDFCVEGIKKIGERWRTL